LRAASFSNEVNDEIAIANILGQLVEEREAALTEVFLDFDLEGMSPERAKLIGKFKTVGEELTTDTR
jgi:hypothetical protein